MKWQSLDRYCIDLVSKSASYLYTDPADPRQKAGPGTEPTYRNTADVNSFYG